MRWIRYVAIALINAVGAVVGVVFVPVAPTLAQPSLNSRLETYQLAGVSQTPRSLPELYKLRDRLKADLNAIAVGSDRTLASEPWRAELQHQQSESILQSLQAVEAHIPIEEKANQTWQQAAGFAQQAVEVGHNPRHDDATWERAQAFWQQAIDTLREIPPNSFLADQAIEKTIEYQGYLAVVTYELQMARSLEKVAIQEQEAERGKKATPTPVATLAPPPGFIFLGDTNRDGIIDEKDELGRQTWSLANGALILFNNNDDSRKGRPDWQDEKVNGDRDVEDLAPIQLKLSENYVGAQIFITADSASRPHINVFQKTADGWQPIDILGTKPLAFDRNIILGIEAKQFADRTWNGSVTLKATAKKDGKQISSDQIQMGVSPWIMSPNTAPVKEILVSDRGPANRDLISQIKQAVKATGAQVKVMPGDRLWMQDSEKFGYVQFPEKSGIRTYNVVLNNPDQGQSKKPDKSLLNQDLGTFEIGKPRTLDVLNQWADGYGNLQVTPPLPGYPMGRIYYGNSGTETLNPEVVDFLKAQQVQGPPVDIDTSWLLIRHVDEIINFIPGQSGKPLMLIVSPEAGVKLLEELQQKGYGSMSINRDLSTQTTVRAALNNQSLIQHNLSLQRDKINPLLDKLKREFQLTDDQIIQVPVMFGYSGYAWWPNLVNSVIVNGNLLISSPRGAMINGRDYTEDKFRQLLVNSDINLTFLSDKYYQELRGNIHSATNTVRQGEKRPFWELLPVQSENRR